MKWGELAFHGKQIADHGIRVSHFPWLRNYLTSLRSPMAVFIWIPKTGGTSVAEALRPAGLRYFQTARDVLYSFPQRGMATFGHMDYAMLVRHGLIDHDFHRSAFKFAFVRNPFTRVTSLYHYLQRKKHVPMDLGIDDFILGVARDGVPPVALDTWLGIAQCNPQASWLAGNSLDFVGRFERLEEDFGRLCAQLRLDTVPVLPKLNRSSGVGTPAITLSGRSVDAVRRYYRQDFEMFGYSQEPEIR